MDDETERTGGKQEPQQEPTRKPYAIPSLRVYGKIAVMTRAVARTTTNPDGGAMLNMSKTH